MADLTAAYGRSCQTDTFVTSVTFGLKISFVKHGANALLRVAAETPVRCRLALAGISGSAHPPSSPA
jgi:hypothetical protein